MFIVVRKAAKSGERDQVYSEMFEGYPKTTLTLGTKAARLDRETAETIAKQLNGMFPAHAWHVVPEGEFRYTPAPPLNMPSGSVD